jgi:SAM-dependent methyltransferase
MSLQTQNDPKNEAEITYWNSAGGRHWVERQQSQDIVLGPILQATLERAQLRQGERVVDIGCGTGASSIALGGRVGPSGQVLSVDVSAPMLARAAERLPPGAPVKFVRADVTTCRFEAAAFDLLFSRFGVMFFAEPARAFANLRTALTDRDRSPQSQRRYARDGRRSRVGGGWPVRSMARPMRPRWRARVRHRCLAATGLTLRDGLTFVETTIRLLLVNRIRSRPDGAGQAGPASRGGPPGIAEWMFPGLLVVKATASCERFLASSAYSITCVSERSGSASSGVCRTA